MAYIHNGTFFFFKNLTRIRRFDCVNVKKLTVQAFCLHLNISSFTRISSQIKEIKLSESHTIYVTTKHSMSLIIGNVLLSPRNMKSHRLHRESVSFPKGILKKIIFDSRIHLTTDGILQST